MAKTLNALILPDAPNVIAERRMIDIANIPAHKATWWRPVETVGNDSFDPKTHKKTGPVTTIEATRVVDTYSIVELTTQEASNAKAAAISAINGVYRPIMKALLDHENRIRAKESPPQAALTMAEYETAFRDLL